MHYGLFFAVIVYKLSGFSQLGVIKNELYLHAPETRPNTKNMKFTRINAAVLMLSALFAAILAACGGKEGADPVRIVRFDKAVAGYSELDSAARTAFRDTFRAVAGIVANIQTKGSVVDADDEFLSDYSVNPRINFYAPGIAERLGPLDSVECALGEARQNASAMLPELRWPEIAGVVLPYNQSVVVADSVVLVGLNHYLGPDYAPYSYFDEYVRLGKQKRLMPYHIVEALVAVAYPYRPSADATALSRMVYEGALSESVMRLLGSSSEADVLGYTAEQLDWACANEPQAWRTLIDKNLLYSTDPVVAGRLVRPSPYTAILHPSSPGRFGRFIGYRIVESYLSGHPSAPLTELLDSAFYNSPTVLVDSNYLPR